MDAPVADDSARTLNMSELAYVIGVSLPTLRQLIQRHGDFPIERRGDKGVDYQFHIDAVRSWMERHEAEKAAAEEDRRKQLDLLASEIYGAPPEGAGPALSPAERKQLAEAVRAEDYNRIKRGDLLERHDVSYRLRQALAHFQKKLRQIPADLARESGIERGLRQALDNLIRQRVNEAIETLLPLLADDDAKRDSA